ncbi:MAG: hypothetical protein Phog2KO_00370 [Phototrophicaceae bacterium]
MKTKAIIITVIVFTLSLFVGVVGAQDTDDTANNRPITRILGSDVVEIVTEATGLTTDEILSAIRDGSTLEEIVTESGADADAVIAEIEAELTVRIETALENERITQEVADTLLENLSDNITTFFTTTHEIGNNRGENLRNRVQYSTLGNLVEVVTDVTGLEISDIREAIQEGATLADLITDNGADVDEVTASIIDNVTTAINERVESGALTQEQADAILENLDSNLTDLMNGEFSLQGRTRGQRGRN